jgi:SAM-dependent methyltransferase
VNPDEVRRRWADWSGEFSPAYYAYRGPNATSEAVHAALERFLDGTGEPSVLELGCGSGRHLEYLHERGYRNLTGVDLNGDALEVMADSYPELADAVTFHHGAIEEVIGGFDTDGFDAVFSVETLQHVHPEADRVFDELARVTADLLVTAEIERPVQENGDGDEDGNGDGREGRIDGAGPGVNYVRGEVPLYYRDWGEVFGDRGFLEVETDRRDRDTVRTFRRVDGGPAD